MITIQKAYEVISDLNDEAHNLTWDLWEEAGDDEDLREEASDIQRAHFQELMEFIPDEQYNAIMHYRRIDETFRDDFNCWYGED
jgi:hypothetical protein